jgi:FkbM family methyltransferase
MATILNRMMKAWRGVLWLAREGGLRGRIAEVESRLAEMQDRMRNADHRLHLLVRHAERNCEVQGHQMILDEKDSLGLLGNGCYEPFETDLVAAHVKKGDVVLDIGANIGYYTLLFARQVGETGRVFAFEPDPVNFSLLKRNVQRNGYRNVELIQKAVAAQTGTLPLYLSDDNRGDHRVYDSHDGRPSIEIEAVSLDDFFKDFGGRIDFIKMDIQGAEGGALRGMAGLLRKHSSVKLLTEFWPVGLHRSGLGAAQFIRMIQQHDFEMYHVNEEAKRLEPADVLQLTRVYTPENENYTNLLCTRAA